MAVPVASVVTEPDERFPVFVLRVTVVLGTTTFAALTAVIVIVVVVELSEVTVAGDLVN